MKSGGIYLAMQISKLQWRCGMRSSSVGFILFWYTKDHPVKLRSFSYQSLNAITHRYVKEKHGKTHDDDFDGNEGDDY